MADLTQLTQPELIEKIEKARGIWRVDQQALRDMQTMVDEFTVKNEDLLASVERQNEYVQTLEAQIADKSLEAQIVDKNGQIATLFEQLTRNRNDQIKQAYEIVQPYHKVA